MKTELPLITLGLTCFNAEDTILFALESAISQTYPNTEVIVVDDCSSDNSVKKIQDSIKNNLDIKLIVHEKNTGFAAALNTIIANANGQLIAWFDDDDISFPDRIIAQYEVISEYKKINKVLMGCWAGTQKEYSNGYLVNNSAIGSREINPKGEDILDYHLNMCPNSKIFFGSGTPSCSLMTYMEVFKSVGLYDENLKRTEDTDFAIRLGLSGGHFIGTKEILVKQKWSSGEDKSPKNELESQLHLINKYQHLFRSKIHYDFAKRWRKIRYFYFTKKKLNLLFSILICLFFHPTLSSKRIKNGYKRILHDRNILKK